MDQLGLKYRLVVAPMAGGPTTPSLVAASSEAGALGSLGAAYLKPHEISEACHLIRSQTAKPFAINLFIPHPINLVTEEQTARAIEATRKFRLELSLPDPKIAPPFEEDFGAQFEAVMREKPAVLSWVFGTLPHEMAREARKAGILLVGAATSVDEAKASEEICDAIVLQGIEAGGHRAIHSPSAPDPELSLAELLETVRIGIPVIAAGGIMTREHVRAALAKGAWAVQMGTAFLCCREAGTASAYRQALQGRRETRTTRVYSGRLARGIKNRFMREMPVDAVLPFPQQNKFTRDLRSAGGADFMSLWSGTGSGSLWEGSCADLISDLMAP